MTVVGKKKKKKKKFEHERSGRIWTCGDKRIMQVGGPTQAKSEFLKAPS